MDALIIVACVTGAGYWLNRHNTQDTPLRRTLPASYNTHDYISAEEELAIAQETGNAPLRGMTYARDFDSAPVHTVPMTEVINGGPKRLTGSGITKHHDIPLGVREPFSEVRNDPDRRRINEASRNLVAKRAKFARNTEYTPVAAVNEMPINILKTTDRDVWEGMLPREALKRANITPKVRVDGSSGGVDRDITRRTQVGASVTGDAIVRNNSIKPQVHSHHSYSNLRVYETGAQVSTPAPAAAFTKSTREVREAPRNRDLMAEAIPRNLPSRDPGQFTQSYSTGVANRDPIGTLDGPNLYTSADIPQVYSDAIRSARANYQGYDRIPDPNFIPTGGRAPSHDTQIRRKKGIFST